MPRRKAFGGGRRSFGKGMRLNTKRGIPTSVSVGGGGFRMNVSSRGVRTSVRNPITGKSTTIKKGRRRTAGGSSKRQANVIWNQRKGTELVAVPPSSTDTVILTVDLGAFTPKRLAAIRDATEKGDTKKEAKELFHFVKDWDIKDDRGSTVSRNHKTLAGLPRGLALALAIEVGNRTGVLVEPIDSGIVIRDDVAKVARSRNDVASLEQPKANKGCLRRLLPFG